MTTGASRALDDIFKQTLRRAEMNADEAAYLVEGFQQHLDTGTGLLIFDGLDEISDPVARARFCERLEKIVVKYRTAAVIATSRIVGYREMGYKLGPDFQHLTLTDLTPEEKDAFIDRWCELTELPESSKVAARDLKRDIHGTEHIEQLTGNPMLLTTMALVRRSIGKLPSRRADLYWEAVQVLLNWRAAVERPLDWREAIPQLEYVAYAMCDRGIMQLRQDEVIALLAGMRQEYPKVRAVQAHSMEDFLKLVERRNLLVEAGHVRYTGMMTPVYEFRHLTFQEYLAARALVDGRFPGRDPQRPLAAHVVPLADKTTEVPSSGTSETIVVESWREVLRLVVAICSDDDVDSVLKAILGAQPRDPEPGGSALARAVLAAQCLTEDEPNVSEMVAHEINDALGGRGDWRRAKLRGADLRGADLSHCDLTGVDLDNAQLDGADLSGATLVAANLRNVSMGKYGNWPTDLTGTTFADETSKTAADLFNYRFHNLEGYYCFWDLALVRSAESILVAGSRGQLLWFDLNAEDWRRPLCLQTVHTGDIQNIGIHPKNEAIVVTSSRDGTVRFHELPTDNALDWRVRSSEPTRYPPHKIEVAGPNADGIVLQLAPPDYPRRAQFSESGRWLIVTSRDSRVLFLRIGDDLAAIGELIPGYAHSGPVMCVAANKHPRDQGLHTSHDRFLTAGYDGRVVIWTEPQFWENPIILDPPAADADGNQDKIRALVANTRDETIVGGRILIATEKERRLRFYREDKNRLVEDAGFGWQFEDAVFALAWQQERNLLAVGLASGCIYVYEVRSKEPFVKWTTPVFEYITGDEIVRALLFIDKGQRLLAATWDGRLFLLPLEEESGGRQLPEKMFEYPEALWQPSRDVANIKVDKTVGLDRSRGISNRMMRYLQLVSLTGQKNNCNVG